MRVLQILPELNVGGVERGCLDLARELVRKNHRALVISNGGSLVKELQSIGVRHFQLPVHKKSLFSILANIPKVAKILREENVDIVHARSRVPALIAFLACRRTQTDFVTTCHGYYSQNFFSRVMGWGKRVIVSSEVVSRHMSEDFGVPRQRLRLIPRGVALEEFKFLARTAQKPGAFTVGVISRLSPIKGHKYFLQALARVVRVSPNIRALIVGDASSGKEKYKDELKMLTRRLSLDKYVEFIGHQSNVPKVLSRLDAMVLPTVTQEAFGRVLIEAGACGVPVIATRVGGVVDIIEDGVNGILVEPQDPYNLAQAIIRLSKEPELRRSYALAARKRVEENFTLEEMAQKTIEVYKEVKTSSKILVIKLSALGDVILAVPSLRALREEFPQAHITVLLARPFVPILQNCPYTDEILELPLKECGYKKSWQASSLLRRLNFDIVIDLQNNRRSHLLSYLSGCNKRYGYDNGKLGFLLNKKAKEKNLPLSPVEHQAGTLRLLGIKSVKENLELWPRPEEENWAEGFLKKQRKKTGALIGINIGASPSWPSKRWGIAKFAALLDTMEDAGMEAVITGNGRDKELLNCLRQSYKNYFIDAVDKTSVMQLACLIKRCNVYITSDSAPLHMAYAAGAPVVALFGPTDPRRHTLTGAKQIVIKKDMGCSPCYKKRCAKHNCLQDITVEEVFAAVNQLLRRFQ